MRRAASLREIKGFVVDTRLEPGARIVTFGNGRRRPRSERRWPGDADRLVGERRPSQPSQCVGSGVCRAGRRLAHRLICDLLPNEMREAIDGMITQGMAAMKRTLDKLGEV
jgi:hypothetical protein